MRCCSLDGNVGGLPNAELIERELPYLTSYATAVKLRCMFYERGQAEKIRREVVVMISALDQTQEGPCTHADLHFVIVVIVDCPCSHVKINFTLPTNM